jgi:hypothetical protein
MNKMLLKKSFFAQNLQIKRIAMQSIVLVLAFFCSVTVFAQKQSAAKVAPKRCGTMEALQEEMLTNPELRARMAQGEIDYQNSLRQPRVGHRPSTPTGLTGPVIIPVVVHVVLPNPWIITDEAIDYFINRLNLDFSGTNPDSTNGVFFYPVRGHSLLRFVRARRDINGNYTTGVVRVVGTTLITTGTNQNIKKSATPTGGSTGWDVTKYYNLYVGDGGPAGLLGISPGIGPGGPAGSNNADGVCVDYRAFGPNCFSYAEYKMSRTSVHEIGHNMGLFHPFDNGCASDDFRQLTSPGCSLPANLLAPADDVPHQSAPTQGCPNPGVANGCTPPATKMFQNYMDYTDDACYSMFTNGEAARMEWVLENCRAGYLTTLGGQYPASRSALDAGAYTVVSPGGQSYDEAVCDGVLYPEQTCPGNFTPRLRITNAGTSVLTSITVTTSVNGQNVQTQTFSVAIAPDKSQIVTLNTQTAVPGANALRFILSAPNGGADGNAINDTLTKNFNVALALPLPYTENFSSAVFPPANGSAVVNPDGGITWERTTTAGRPGPASVAINLYNYDSIGRRDIYKTPPVDVSVLDSLKITFYVAHQQYGTATVPGTNDSLRVLYSPDCGASWYPTTYAKGGAVLSTVAGVTNADFIPSGNAQWRKETVVLKDFCAKGLKTIQIGFESYNDFGNNIFVDSINISGPPASSNNAAVLKIVQPSISMCTTNFTPQALIGNEGKDTLRTLTIKYVIDRGTNASDSISYSWTGKLGRCDNALVSLPPVTLAYGTHTIDVLTVLPNGVADQVPSNDKLAKSFTVFNTANAPIFEGFEGTTFPPTNWAVLNENNDVTWQRSTSSARTGTSALWINNPTAGNANGAIDYFISPIVVNSATNDSVFVDFDLAYKSGPIYPGSTVLPLDTLEVLATADCGLTFTSVWKKWGYQLQTVNDPNYTFVAPFVPLQKGEWKSNRIYLSPSVGANNFQLYFTAKGNRQNNIWLDNINITSKVLPQKLKDQGYLIYPNPFNSTFLIHHSAVEPPLDLRSAQVFNSAGQLVWEKQYNGNADRQITVDLKNQSKGVYILKMIYTNKTIIERLVKN